MRIEPKGPHDFGVNGYVLAQVPNAPLIVALIAVLASRILSEDSSPYFFARAVLYMGITVWAYLEMAEGVNGFRKVLGAGALVWIAFSLKNEF